MYIDPHVHFRDEDEAAKETIAHGLAVAGRVGMNAVFDMPNTQRPVTTRKRVEERLALAEAAHSPVRYYLYMALLADRDQNREAVRTCNAIDEVVGFKLYAGHSTNTLGVTDPREQRRIFRRLARWGYHGVVAVHAEQENLLRKRQDSDGRYVQDWDPRRPVTHAYARPPEAEVESVRDMIGIAADTGFKGTLHIAHISVPEAVELVDAVRSTLRITCGVTPHHILFDETRMEKADGLYAKMNPPLRPTGMNVRLLDYLRNGKIDWIETDHAPHTCAEKEGPPYASGIPVLHAYDRFVRWLREKQGFGEELLTAITFDRIADAYELFLLPSRVCIPHDARDAYQHDLFAGVI